MTISVIMVFYKVWVNFFRSWTAKKYTLNTYITIITTNYYYLFVIIENKPYPSIIISKYNGEKVSFPWKKFRSHCNKLKTYWTELQINETTQLQF